MLRAKNLLTVFGAPQKRVVYVLAANGVVERVSNQIQCFVLRQQPVFGGDSRFPADFVGEFAALGIPLLQSGNLRLAVLFPVLGPTDHLDRGVGIEVDWFPVFQDADGAFVVADFHLVFSPGANGGGDILFDDHFASSFQKRRIASYPVGWTDFLI